LFKNKKKESKYLAFIYVLVAWLSDFVTRVELVLTRRKQTLEWLDNRSRALSYPTPAWVSENHWSQATWGLVALQTQTIYEARKNPITPPAH